MPCSSLVLISALVGLASYTVSAAAAPKKCPTSKAGPFETTIIAPYEATRTFYPQTFYDGVFINCHGHTTVDAITEYPTAESYVTVTSGDPTSPSYMCSPTSIPAGCHTKA